jgi:hypothetical protein
MSIPFHLMDPKISNEEAIRRMQEWNRSTFWLKPVIWVTAAICGVGLIVVALINSA